MNFRTNVRTIKGSHYEHGRLESARNWPNDGWPFPKQLLLLHLFKKLVEHDLSQDAL